ncbi:choice-of-anchor U domain-containing protein, partial [uncultured Thiohalocapsa sp.]|uniref:choice-of-anchor U domain-containing protein n=1 Tax=uncultured Thiohalocapsa sp. TaxID=768990 RepID=UPI0025DDD634
VAGLTYWKYIDDAWTPMTDGVTLAGDTATLTIADNGPFDADPNEGSIADLSGPAVGPACAAGVALGMERLVWRVV